MLTSREDLALRVEHDATSGKLLVRCMSGDHLRIVADRLKDRYGMEVELGRPPVQCRETLIKPLTNVEEGTRSSPEALASSVCAKSVWNQSGGHGYRIRVQNQGWGNFQALHFLHREGRT